MQVQQAKSGYKYINVILNINQEVPEDWQIRRLGSFAKEINLRYSEYKDGPVLSVTKYRGFVKSLEYFKRQVYSKDIENYKLVEKGDFAYATIHLDEGSLGLLREFDRGYISPMYTVFRTDNSINSDFLYLLLRSNFYLQIYNAIGKGSINRRKSISFDNLSQLKIPMPSVKEQRKIAFIISKVDELIQKTDQLIEQTQRLKKGLMQMLLTKGIGHSEFVKTRVGEVPRKWQIVRMKELVSSYKNGIYKEQAYHGHGIFYIRMFNIGDGKINSTETPLLEVTPNELVDYGLRPGDILLNRVNGSTDLVGKAGILEEDIGPAVFDAMIIRIRVLKDRCLPQFLNYFLNTNVCFRQIRGLIKHVNQSSINQEDLDSINVALPSISEQLKIISIISIVDKKIQFEERTMVMIKEIKKGLMQKLLTGKIRVRV